MVGIKFTKVQTHYRVSDQINASCLNVRIYAPSVAALQQIILHYYFATLGTNVNWLVDLLDFGQLFKAFDNN